MKLLRLPVWLIAVLGALVAVYLLVGFLVAPGLVRDAVIRGASQKLTRSPSLRRVEVNPLNLSLRLEGFSLDRADGKQVLGFDELYIRLDPFGSLIDRGLTLARLRLDRPRVAVEVRPGGALDIAELIRPDSTAPDTTTQPPPFHVRRLQITAGSASFADRGRTPVMELIAGSVDLRLEDFRTRRGADNTLSLHAATAAGESLHWEARFVLAPFHSDGTLEIANLHAQTLTRVLGPALPFSMPHGTVDLGLHYRVDARVAPTAMSLDGLHAEVRDWALATRGGDTTVVELRRAALRGGTVDVNHLTASLDTIIVDGGSAALWMNPDHHLNLEAWASPPDTTQPPAIVRVHGIGVSGMEVRYEDRQVGPPAVFEIHDVAGGVTDLSTEGIGHATLRVTARLFENGHAEAEGHLALNPPASDLKIALSGFPLRSVQPYMNHVNRLSILSGVAGGKGRFRFNTFGSTGPMARYEGSAEVRDFRSVDKKLHQDLLRWRTLRLDALRFDMTPSLFETKRVVVDGGYARVTVGPDRIPNLATVALPPDSVAGYSTMVTDSSDTLRARIDRVEIHDATATFADLSMQPNFSTGIEKLEGQITGLSSFQESGGDIKLDGQVDRYAPVSVRGAFNPLSKGGHTDVAVSFQHIELTTFTPYSGRFMGYRIERGKLSLDLHYVVDGRQLVGQNKILMEQFTLGERVDSPEATHLPVRFAIALLKDRHGNIDLDLPVKGDLDDPKFSIGRIIIKVLVNLVEKAVTSPFKALGALVGGGEKEQLDVVEFAAGGSALDSSQTGRLDKLGHALGDRPELRLDIPTAYDSVADVAALTDGKFDERLGDAIAAAPRGGAHRGAGGVTPTAEDSARAIEHLYVADFGSAPPPVSRAGRPKPRKGVVDTVLVAAETARTQGMVERLRESVRLDPTDLSQLGQARALVIKDHLVALGVDAAQLFVVNEASPGHVPGPTVRVQLALNGR
ncbi:MAG: DUF748 domain-containing protein [Candidatus Eisenbacteria bacterium]